MRLENLAPQGCGNKERRIHAAWNRNAKDAIPLKNHMCVFVAGQAFNIVRAEIHHKAQISLVQVRQAAQAEEAGFNQSREFNGRLGKEAIRAGLQAYPVIRHQNSGGQGKRRVEDQAQGQRGLAAA